MKRLEELEAIVDRGFETFLEVADALHEIYERKLYLDAGHHSYSTYCRERFSMSSSSVYNYLRARDVVRALPVEERAGVSVSKAVVMARIPASQRHGMGKASVRGIQAMSKKAGWKRPASMNAGELASFTEYCRKHPEAGFWAALKAWIAAGEILVDGLDCSELDRDVLMQEAS